jgi:hypothetical protein
VSAEIEPYILYRVEGAQLECALWQLQQGERALAVFLSADSATAYRDAARLAGWRVLRPGREALLELVRAHVGAGVRYAVLDPDLAQAKRIFDLQAILEAAGPAEGPGP